jgi:predicted secreted protein
MVKFCTNCGAAINEEESFCMSCGAKCPVVVEQTQPAQQLAQQEIKQQAQPTPPSGWQTSNMQPPQLQQQYIQQPVYQPQVQPAAVKKKKSKTPFIIGGTLVFINILLLILVLTNVFGLLNITDGDIIRRELSIDGVKQKITSVKLGNEIITTLKVGEICHFLDDEKQSIPYRWAYYISNENVIGYFYDEYEDNSGIFAGDGGDKGWRWIYFKALAPGECVITMRYEDVRDKESYLDERIYIVESNTSNPDAIVSATSTPQDTASVAPTPQDTSGAEPTPQDTTGAEPTPTSTAAATPSPEEIPASEWEYIEYHGIEFEINKNWIRVEKDNSTDYYYYKDSDFPQLNVYYDTIYTYDGSEIDPHEFLEEFKESFDADRLIKEEYVSYNGVEGLMIEYDALMKRDDQPVAQHAFYTVAGDQLVALVFLFERGEAEPYADDVAHVWNSVKSTVPAFQFPAMPQFGGDWPDNEFTRILPKPDFAVSFAQEINDGFTVMFSANIDQLKAYVEQVKAAGFTVGAYTQDTEIMGMAIYSYNAKNADGFEVNVYSTSGASGLNVFKR